MSSKSALIQLQRLCIYQLLPHSQMKLRIGWLVRFPFLEKALVKKEKKTPTALSPLLGTIATENQIERQHFNANVERLAGLWVVAQPLPLSVGWR